MNNKFYRENRKIKNATLTAVDGIQFKSKLEKAVYEILKENGITPDYEQKTYVLSPSIRPRVPFYTRGKSKDKKPEFHYEMKPLSSITYTPDFTFVSNGVFVIFEVKGFENDVYYLKKNLFRKYLDELYMEENPMMFFEIKSKRDVDEALKVIKGETGVIIHIRQMLKNIADTIKAKVNKWLGLGNTDAAIQTLSKYATKSKDEKLKQELSNIKHFDKNEKSIRY